MIRLKALLTILIVGSGIYVGSKVVPAYYTYYRFQSDLEQRCDDRVLFDQIGSRNSGVDRGKGAGLRHPLKA